MIECSNDLRDAGLAYPRTCAWCGLGPCRKERQPPIVHPDIPELVAQIADQVYPHIQDRQRRDTLAYQLTLFAAEIKRSALER